MKKLMTGMAAAVIVGTLCGCGSFKDKIAVDKATYVPAGDVRAFTPASAVGGALVKVRVGDELAAQIAADVGRTNDTFTAKGLTVESYLLVNFKEKQ